MTDLAAWAEARGIDLEEVRRDGLATASRMVGEARERRIRAIDKALAESPERADLYLRGKQEAAAIKAERARHRVMVDRVRHGSWQAVCRCEEWFAPLRSTRRQAERDAINARERLDAGVGHE